MSKLQDFSSENSAAHIAVPPSRGEVPPPSTQPPIVKPKPAFESSFGETASSSAATFPIPQQPIQFSTSDVEIFSGIESEASPHQEEESQSFLVYLVLATSLVALGIQIWMLF